jgi:multicomponent Na+:H+ antiporter subunit C
MNTVLLYALTAIGLFCIGLHALLRASHLLRRLLAINIMGSSVFLLLVALAARSTPPDPVPHAMVITGIVVAVAATALGLNLMLKIVQATGSADLPEVGAAGQGDAGGEQH